MASMPNIQGLAERLRRFLHYRPPSGSETRQEIIEAGDFRIDLRSHQVLVRGEELRLSSEEFDMLVFLALHPRRIVTPRTLLSTRWVGHEVRQADFLRVLNSLRGKIESVSSGARYIRTEPWVFYRFEPGDSSSQSGA